MAAPLDRVKALLAVLPREDQEDLTRYLHDILVTPEEAEARHVASLQAAKGGRLVTYTFRQEWVKCGKVGCRCAQGQAHGPYTYKYWKEDGRLRKQYVGKREAQESKLKRPGAAAGAGRGRSSSARSRSGPTPPA